MAYKVILHVDGERRELLSFDIRYFKARTGLFSDWLKDNQLRLLDELSLIAKADPYAFIATKGVPFGGLLELTMASTDNDDRLYEWFIPSKLFGIRIKHGVIEFYDDDDDYIPFRRIEFWDAWVVDISETMCSTGSEPMTLKLRISPATVRYDKLIVVQQSWWITDINESAEESAEESELFVNDIKWRGRNADYVSSVERKDMMLNHKTTLEVEVRDFAEGESFELTVRQSKGRRIKGNGTEFTIQGTVNDSNIVMIEDFKVECDFADDNQDFGNIEFYHNERKVAEFKENFGWTYVKINGQLKIFANVGLKVEFLPKGLSEAKLKKEMSAIFARTLQNSSGGAVTGKIFFNGTATRELPQFVPELSIFKQNDPTQLGLAVNGYVSIFIDPKLTPSTILDATETVVHELLHSLRLRHPFETTQYVSKPNPIMNDPAPDTKLVVVEGKHQSTYTTLPTTDPNIKYNIMNYDNIYIDGVLLRDLWKTKRPEYLTKGQLQLIFDEIDGQQNGYGTDVDANKLNLPTQSEYWDKEKRGDSLRPNRDFSDNPVSYDD